MAKQSNEPKKLAAHGATGSRGRVRVNFTIDAGLYDSMVAMNAKEPGIHNWSRVAEMGIKRYIKKQKESDE